MRDEICPRCGNRQAVRRIINDRFRAVDPHGGVFEVTLQEPVWSCPACRMSWESEDTFIAKEEAYQAALFARSQAVDR